MFRQMKIPRWQGFNLDDLISQRGEVERFSEEDFQFISDLGFNFVRLALNYKNWIDQGDWSKINEQKLEIVDQAVIWGEKYGVHVNLSFHRGPGYCIAPNGYEPYHLFRHQEALEIFILHWTTFARRYRSTSTEKVSFNLLNEPRGFRGEPPGVDPAGYSKIMRQTIKAIRDIDAGRIIILDGLDAGHIPPTDLFDLGDSRVAFSMRAYTPGGVTHYKAKWDGNQRYDLIEPKWPGGFSTDGSWDRERLRTYFKIWGAFAESSATGLHCGEGGCYNQTPHPVVLAWLEDVLATLTEMNTGFALWNLRGPFGILDSGRSDVDYEDWRGHQLDREMLDLLRKYSGLHS
jgi:endoglucanase